MVAWADRIACGGGRDPPPTTAASASNRRGLCGGGGGGVDDSSIADDRQNHEEQQDLLRSSAGASTSTSPTARRRNTTHHNSNHHFHRGGSSSRPPVIVQRRNHNGNDNARGQPLSKSSKPQPLPDEAATPSATFTPKILETTASPFAQHHHQPHRHHQQQQQHPSTAAASTKVRSNDDDNWKFENPYAEDFGPMEPPSVTSNDNSSDNDNNQLSPTPRIYSASCYCGRVRYDVKGDPLTSKMCHCGGCQLLHGAPFEWVAVFDKRNVRFNPCSLQYLYFYNSELDRGWSSKNATNRQRPVKVSCSHCRSPVADEGHNSWLAFCTLFGFTKEDTAIPKAFRHSCHLFYKQRCIDLRDEKTKWDGLETTSSIWQPDWDE